MPVPDPAVTSLVSVAHYLPERSVAIADYLRHQQMDEQVAWLEKYCGFARVRRDPDQPLAEQLIAAATKLPELAQYRDRVRYLVHAPTIQFTAPYPNRMLGTVREALGLQKALPFSLGQHACASVLLSIDVCGRLLETDHDSDGLALILAGEKTFTQAAQIIPYAAVMGEGTAAALVRAGGDRDRLLGYEVRTLGAFHLAPFQDEEREQEFHRIYPDTLTEVIQAAVNRAGIQVTDLSAILPHNVSKLSWLRVSRQLGISPRLVVLDNQPELGHCFGADPLINYLTIRHSGRLRRGDYYVMTAAGLGATLAAMVFQH